MPALPCACHGPAIFSSTVISRSSLGGHVGHFGSFVGGVRQVDDRILVRDVAWPCDAGTIARTLTRKQQSLFTICHFRTGRGWDVGACLAVLLLQPTDISELPHVRR